MSKLYQLNRMKYAPAAGGLGSLISKGIGAVGGLIGGLFKKKSVAAVGTMVAKVAKNPLAQTAAVVGATELASGLLSGGGAGASGGWTRRRAKGITGTELRGFHKVARLLHKEGMVVKHARRG